MPKTLKRVIKSICNAVALVCMFVPAALAGFGKFSMGFKFFAQWVALIPGLPGDYLRVAYYHMTLEECPLYSRVSFGSFFAQSSVVIGSGVYIGPYCVIGSCRIGDRTQIASQVQLFAGGRQHPRAIDGQILGADERLFQQVNIGHDCWIGAAALVMAEVGSGTTIGAGSVVTKPVPENVVAVGNPVRVLVKESV
jgi:virginiamycin A acetyltransferase